MLAKALAFALFGVILLVVLAAIGVFVKMLALFLSLLLGVMLIPMLVAGFAWLRIRAKKREDTERSRASILKQVWEEQQHREW